MSINAIKKSTHKLIVDVLQEDGVLCNSGTKTYDELGTYATGGKGLRHSFHHLNNTINLYHNFLKILTGDERANIYESIPVIDFLDTDNTSLLNHYTFNEDGSLNTTSIQSIPVNTTAEILAGTAKKSLDYILNDDPYTINRAVMGDVVAEQFFNTTEAISNDLNIVTVSSPDRETGLCYKGILSREMVSTDGIPFKYTKASPVFTYKVLTGLQLEIDWDDSTSLLSNVFVDENNKNISYNEYFNSNKLLLDVYAKDLEVKLPNSSSGFIKSISQDRYRLNLAPGDVCVILPKVAYSLDPTKVVIFRKEDASAYILYIRDYTSSKELDIINPEENLPSYITDSHLNILSCYANIEKEYYADASGLMNGCFCEPKYTENNTTGRRVTKWKFLNNSSIAAAKSRTIPVGSKYYENHLLYRGSFKDEPLACRDSNKGIASYLYTELLKQSETMLGENFFIEESSWKSNYLSSNATTLDFVITEEVLANPDKFALKNKIKKLDGTAVTYDDVVNLLDNAIGVIEGTTLKIDTSESFVCRELRESRDAKAADWWDKLFADSSSLLENTSDNFDNSFETFISLKYFRHKDCYKVKTGFMQKEKRYTVDEYFGGFTLDRLYSPLDILNHKLEQSTENDTLLLWPGSHSSIPEEIVLLSRNNLQLTNKDLLLFYKNADESNRSFIGFQVDSIEAFKPSLVDTIVITDHTDDPEADDKNPSKTFSVEPVIKGHDCYIYYLKNYSLNTEGIEYTDHTNTRVALSDVLVSIPLTPLAYPYSYFKGESSIDSLTGRPLYSLDKNHYNDVYGLQGAYLVRGIPRLENEDEEQIDVLNYSNITIGDSNVSLSVINDYIEDLNHLRTTASQKALYHVLYNWPLTDSEENPITLGNFSKVVHGLYASSDIISEVANLKLFKDEDQKYVSNSLNNLQHRLLSTDVKKNSYVSFANLDATVAPSNISFDSKKSFSENLSLTIKDEKKITFNCRLLSTQDTKRPSLLSVAKDIDAVFSSSKQSLTLEAASMLDSYLGNGTLSLLTIAKAPDSRPYIDVNGLESQLETSIAKTIKLLDESYKKDLYNRLDSKDSLLTWYNDTYQKAITSLSSDTFKYSTDFGKKQDDVVNFWHLSQPSFFNKLLGNSSDTTATFVEYVKVITERELAAEKYNSKVYYKGFIEFANFDKLQLADITWDTLYIDNIPEAALMYAFNSIKSDMSALARILYSSPKKFLEYLKSTSVTEESARIIAKAKASVVSYIQNNVVEDEDSIRRRVELALLPLRDAWMNEVNNKLANALVTIFPLPTTVVTLDEFNTLNIAATTLEEVTGSNLLLIQCMSYYLTAVSDPKLTELPKLLPFLTDDYVEEVAHQILRGNREESSNYAFINVEGNTISVVLPEIDYASDTDCSSLQINWKHKKKNELTSEDYSTISLKEISGGDIEISYTSPDVVASSLDKLVTYIVNSLEGVEEGPAGVRYLSTDKQAVGRKDSLYYRRYINLNSRMNKLQGPLSKVPLFSKGTEMSDITQMQNSQLAESYRDILTVIPVLKMTPIQYMKTQVGSSTEIAINGKFYYQEVLEAMKDIIGNNCVLTCGTCTVKDNCPFYNEDEVINLYCNPATTLDLYVKDNELDLLVYDETSPRLSCTEADGSIKILNLNDACLETSYSENANTTIHNFHKPYAEIQKMSVDGNNTNITATTHQINNIVKNLQYRANELEFNDSLDTTGWLLGGRYGTVEYNPGKNLTSTAYPEIIPPSYKFMYNAMFIPDEDTEVAYKASTTAYDVELDLYENGVKKHYTGTTKIKIPTTLKGLQGLPSDAQVYLASDDFKDAEGNDILPLIYLNTVQNLRYVFDLTDTGNNADIQFAEDKTLYAKDVAQWSINIAKGACYDEPVTSNINRDQYWMSTIKKKVWDEEKQREKWITLPGRPRYKEGYQELVNDPQVTDPSRLVAGKPVVSTYENFMRRISFGMYSSSGVDAGSWLIEWISPKEQEALRDNPAALEKKKEIQRATLPLMKTNLRLVIVK